MGVGGLIDETPTSTRRLPWDRLPGEDAELEALLTLYTDRWPGAETDLICHAFDVAREAHEGQMRRTGEAYIHHPLAVAAVVAELGLDAVSISAALLHDAVEDTGITHDDLVTGFGESVAAIVDGVTKLERITFNSKEAQQAATMRKMLVAMAKDLRVLIIKLSDRLHNMRTIAVMRPDKQVRIATETLDIYAPLAHRLGMQEVKMQLEDLAFAAKYPRRFAEIEQMVDSRAPERIKHFQLVTREVEQRLDELGIHALVRGRRKHLWSIYEKMIVKGREFSEIHDLVAIRVIVDNVRDCYAALGCIHSAWRPVQGRFKDYIAMPKFNLYQSLHTTVVGPGGRVLEVQIRTKEMHQRAEYGIAAHWQYKSKSTSAEIPWLDRIVDWESEVNDPDEFMSMLKIDLEQDEVFVFTPKGDVMTLPRDATPVDFAYAIHTEVGDACIGARVDGRLVPLDTKLTSGDAIEVFTSNV
ncbi:MAG: bifunctional (p)ppGpp synthetase/guanosine-3',5'-bis(diphosphate) 3'-pyrophosphohydrolase, partial [Acidimicrobiales bacterium]